MKAAKTMLAIAKQSAIEKGLRIVSDAKGHDIVGYAFTPSEIRAIYQAEGFTQKTMNRHLESWVQLGLIVPVGKIWYVRLSEMDIEPLADLAEERRARELKGDLDCRYVSEASA